MSSEHVISAHHLSKWFELGLSGRRESLRTIFGRRIRHPIRGRGERRERFVALEDVSFDVERGEAVGVIGRNGAGKSTLLKILSRITPPSDGYVDIAGHVGSLLEVGTGFHPELTGLENVYLNGTILGMSKRSIDARLEEIVAFAEVDRFLDTPVKRYSSGMRVRLAFSVAAHLDPEVLIVDEVLSVGDATFQVKCLDKMRSFATDRGRTVLYVSHNLVTVENLCPRAMLLVDGHLVFDGNTQEALSRYLRVVPPSQRNLQQGVFDLVAVDRPSHARASHLFRELTLRPNGDHPADTVRMGDRLQIEVAVEGLDEEPAVNVGIVVGSAANSCLFRLTGRMRPLQAAQDRRRNEKIVVDIPSLPLLPGTYHIDIAIHENRQSTLLDEVNRAAEFTVIPADVLGTGYTFEPRDGQFFVPWDWEVRPATTDPAATTTTAAAG